MLRLLIITILVLTALSSPILAEGLLLRFDEATGPENKAMRQALIDSGRFQNVIEKINRVLIMPGPVNVRFDDGDEGTPYYDPEDVAIVMEYGFFTETDELLADEGIRERERFQTILSVGEFFFYHELGHALIDTMDVPVVGKEEDAADGLAAFVILEITREPQVALAAARQFLLESEVYEQSEEDSFYGEHSLDRQRFYNIVAWIYGSNPDLYEDAVDELVPEDWWDERAEMAIEEYESLVESWEKLLGSSLKR